MSDWNVSTTSTGCVFADGPDRVYAVKVPAHSRLLVTATSAAADLAVSIIDGAAAACQQPVTCVGSSDGPAPGDAETTRFFNATGSEKTVFVIVDRFLGSPSPDTFNLNISFTSAPALAGGESCGAPVAIGANAVITSTTNGMTNNYSFDDNGNCEGTDTNSIPGAPDAVFQTTIPANSKLTVSAFTNLAWDHTLNVIAAPASTCGTGMGDGIVCLAGTDEGNARSPITVSVSNVSETPRPVYIMVDGYGPDDHGTFELNTSTESNGYTVVKADGAANCESLTSGSTVLLSTTSTPVIADDAASALNTLPFDFKFFNTPVTHYSVNTNGLMQVFASGAGVPSGAYDNESFPTPGDPNGLLGPFWDDLNFVSSTEIRSKVLGISPNRHLTVEWFDSQVESPSTRLRFQVQIFETSNIVQFHYCSLAGALTERTSGGNASIGLENLDGTSGIPYSHLTRDNIAEQTKLTFTPQ